MVDWTNFEPIYKFLEHLLPLPRGSKTAPNSLIFYSGKLGLGLGRESSKDMFILEIIKAAVQKNCISDFISCKNHQRVLSLSETQIISIEPLPLPPQVVALIQKGTRKRKSIHESSEGMDSTDDTTDTATDTDSSEDVSENLIEKKIKKKKKRNKQWRKGKGKDKKSKRVVVSELSDELVNGIRELPIDDECDGDELKFLGKKHWAIYLFQKKINDGASKTCAYSYVADILEVGVRSIERWVACYKNNENSLIKSLRGKHPKVQWTLSDFNKQEKAKEFIRGNLRKKGQQNLNGKVFADWVNKNIMEDGETIHENTARKWLHRLGFHREEYKKGVFVDGHDRADVVNYSKSSIS